MIGVILPTILLLTFSIGNLFGIRASVLPQHIVFIITGGVLFFVLRRIGLPYFRVNIRIFYILFIVLLIITFLIGIEVKGSQRWIDVGFTRFQPSEFFKLIFIIFFADIFARLRSSYAPFPIFVKALIAFIIPTLIVFKQPDLGNALVYSYTFGIMLLFSGLPRRYFISLVVFIIVLLPIFWFTLHGYQRDRLVSFILPHTDQQGASYNMTQAVITVGSGTVVGRGLGGGTQSRLSFLPENHTDFAYSSLVEQFGFIGGGLVIVLFIFICIRMVKVLIRYIHTDDDHSRFLFLYTLGTLSCFVFHIMVNIGMNMGLFPITGIPLPFISYGGSSLVTWMMLFAFIPWTA